MARVGDTQIWTVLPPYPARPEDLYAVQIEKASSLPPKPAAAHSSQPKACRWRRASIVSVLVTVVAAVVLAVGVTLYFTAGDAEWEEEEADMLTADTEGSLAVEGRFRITNRPYSGDLRDRTSRAYIRLSAEVLQSLDQLFLQSYLVRDYNTTRIVSYADTSEGVLAEVHVIFNRQFPNLAQQVGMILVQALERGHGHLPAGTLHLDIRSISFADLANPVEVTPPPPSYPDAGWSPWSEWTSCIDQVRIACDPHRARSRSRECRSGWGQGHRLPSVEPCVTGQGGREFEVRECRCEPPPDVMMGDGPAISAPIAPAGPCGRCHVHEICLLTGGVARCVWPRAMGPCGGWCEAQHEVCKALGNGTFQCIDDSGELSFVPLQPVRTSDRPTSAAECLPEEWRCGNGLCIPLARRCDGHANCYDMTDEFDCPCTNGFHCGNGTSCLEPHQRCNGVPECWDGSDEANCTTGCQQDSQFACNSGQCVERELFCDGFADCADHSDEPSGCEGPCLPAQRRCGNRRCAAAALWCDGKDDCGDGSDEKNCPAS